MKYLKEKMPPRDNDFEIFLKKIDFLIDKDYLTFMKEHDGAEGYLDEENCVLFWSVKEVVTLNPYYDFEPACDDYFFFGSNGSSSAYIFDKRKPGVFFIDFLEIGTEEPKLIAPTFKLFIGLSGSE